MIAPSDSSASAAPAPASPLCVVHLAAECAPLAKVGGLGDVLGALPGALAAEGLRPAVVMPLYGGEGGTVAARAGALEEVFAGEMPALGRRLAYRVLRGRLGAAVLYLLDEPVHFGREGVYFDAETNTPFENDETRFLAFQMLALDWLARGEAAGAPRPDVLHAHDHHTGLVPVLTRHHAEFAALAHVPVVFTVHSADHQGVYRHAVWERLGLWLPDPATVLVEEELNMMKAALYHADAVTTVSPSYAEQLRTDDAVAHGLAEDFRAAAPRTLGILNGVDPSVWNPATDPHLAAPFSADDLAGKAVCKRALCETLGLDPARPLLAFVGRLMPEKGVEILFEAAEHLVRRTEASLALLGTGYPEHEARLRGLAALLRADGYAGRLAARIAFDEALAHRFYAGADVFLMPSRHEPCGLGQLYAMAYGTPPVVHATGGLRDTVRPWDGTHGTGFAFDTFTAEAFARAAKQALEVFADAEAWRRIQRAGMTADWSWAPAARAYAALYRDVCERAPALRR